MTGPRSRRRRFFFFFFACQLSIPNQTGYIHGVQYCNRVCIWMFLVRYIVTGCIFRAPSAIWQGQVLTPPQRHPPYLVEKSSAPPPPGKSAYLATGTDYSVYNRVAFPPTMFMTGPRSRHRRDATRRCVRDIELHTSEHYKSMVRDQYSHDP